MRTLPGTAPRRRRGALVVTIGVAWLAFTSPAPLAQSGDSTPPSLAERSPEPDAPGVPAASSVVVVFSEPVQPDTIMIVVRNGAGQKMPARVSYDAPTATATLDPVADLVDGDSYTVTVSGARDLAGNVMGEESWSFTTAAALFVDELTPQTGLMQPTVIEFAADGRMFVAQKDGRIWVYDDLSDATPTLVADLRMSVYNFWDRGLLGMALHPAFPGVPFVYVLYAYDALPGDKAPRWGSPPYTSDPCPNPPGSLTNGCVVSGRLTRLDIGDPALWPLDYRHEEPLITDWPQQFPSHAPGALTFGADGALYASGGDGAGFTFVDYGQVVSTPALGDPVNEGGSLRSLDLLTDGDPVTLDGTVIRVDPDRGLALPDNPRYGSDSDPNGQRIVAYGLRQPFRMTTRPGTREIWIGEVGWMLHEEINRLLDPTGPAAANFGWPCYEGRFRQSGYEAAGLPLCQGLYAAGEAAVVAPHYDYAHADTLEGCTGGSSSITGLAFYPTTGGAYPPAYAGALFFSDYSRSCIWAMRAGPDGLPNTADVVRIQRNTAGPVNLVVGPSGDVFYPGFNDSRIHRLRFGGSRPDAALQADPVSGSAPLDVTFSAGGSTDPDGGTLTYAWDLDGDGAFDDGTGVTAQWTYTSAGVFSARVRAIDPAGLSDVAEATILVDNSPPTALIDSPSPASAWRVGDVIAFSGHATDPDEPSGLPPSGLSWELVMHHCPSNCHAHGIQTFTGVSGGSFPAPDHEYPSFLELRLTATDATGLQHTTAVNLQPVAVQVTLATNPPGLSLGLNAEASQAPFSRTVIVGSANSVSAPLQQQLGGTIYQFSSWSDEQPATHNIVAPAAPATWTANYEAVGPAPPPDTTNPTVAVTSPASGAVVSGVVTVAASASDNVGVASVRFFVDGTPLGGPVATAPYQVAWDSATTKAGVRVITATAVDAAGNAGVASPVTVTVEGAVPIVGLTSAGGRDAAEAMLPTSTAALQPASVTARVSETPRAAALSVMHAVKGSRAVAAAPVADDRARARAASTTATAAVGLAAAGVWAPRLEPAPAVDAPAEATGSAVAVPAGDEGSAPINGATWWPVHRFAIGVTCDASDEDAPTLALGLTVGGGIRR